ncbi:hypothetical protein K490DRAFT_33272 [Saccharata proteae CBS 121410]|uniref:SMP-30/Gluconolactonase/LRE-like region domain-containing protein n=1 Tax=Saccharata proteae CBS 121410 TaxID=1314787 RepID=A0A9P4HWL3_9PEZI|nr:hypothetical protein K490DRAFT_33272 [Saccharata proteae CBS 121410]
MSSAIFAQNATGDVSIPDELTYLLPIGFTGNRTLGFTATNTSNDTVNSVLRSAATATFVSYDPEFDEIFGPSPVAQLVAPSSAPYAFEGAVCVPDRNEVWFSSNVQLGITNLHVLNLRNNTVRAPSLSGDPVVNPNGGYYFDGLVYFTCIGNATYASNIVSINPVTGVTETIVNSYFGTPFYGIDDLTWVKSRSYSKSSEKEAYMFFTTVSLGGPSAAGGVNETVTVTPQLPEAVWRFSPSSHLLQPVISRADISEPNGIRVNAEMTKLFVTDTPSSLLMRPGQPTSGSPAIFQYDLDDEGIPLNKRLFGIAAQGIPDGIHIDDDGRVWTGEGNGIVVRNSKGKTIGVINKEPLLDERFLNADIAQVALAGDKLVVLAIDRLWVIQLRKSIISPGRYQL